MKQNKLHNSDSFIPAGLEFREEYLESALSMYRRRKLMIRRRKILAGGGIAVILLSGLFVWMTFFNEVGVNQRTDVSGSSTIPSPNQTIQLPESGLQTNESGDANTEVSNTARQSAENSSDVSVRNSSDSGKELSEHIVGNEISGHRKISKRTSGKAAVISADRSGVVSGIDKSADNNPSLQNSGYSSANDVEMSQLSADLEQQVRDNWPVDKVKMVDFIEYRKLTADSELPGLMESGQLQVPQVKRFKAYISAGIVAFSDYGSARYDFHADPVIGLGLDYRMRNQVSLGFELNYFSVSGLSNQYVVTQTTYGQGFETSRTIYNTEKLHYAGGGLSLRKVMAGKHQFTAGYHCDFLLTGNNSISTEFEDSFQADQGATRKATGYVDGFNSLNQALSFGYQYWLGKGKAIGFQYRLGLTDITKEKYFRGSDADRNNQLNVYLRVNLSK